MTFCLGLGLFFLALYSGYAERVYGILFGTILGISSSEVKLTLISSLLILLCLAGIFRPLLFSTIAAESAPPPLSPLLARRGGGPGGWSLRREVRQWC